MTRYAFKIFFRSPLRTIVTFLLVLSSSFVLYSRLIDYAVTVRETKKVRDFYHGVATMDNTVPDMTFSYEIESEDGNFLTHSENVPIENKPWLTKEEMTEFASLPGATLSDIRYMTAGQVGDYKRLVEYEGNNRLIPAVIECTYAGYENTFSDREDYINLQLHDVKVIACETETGINDSVEIKNLYLNGSDSDQLPCTRKLLDDLNTGSRCLLLLWYDLSDGNMVFNTNSGEQAFRVLNEAGDNYLESEEFAYHKGMVEAINRNIYTYDMVYTSDMRAIPSLNKRDIVMKEGRLLTMEDQNVCVVNEHFLEDHNLSIGDTIRVELGDKLMHQSSIYGARAWDSQTLSRYISTAKVEIIGSYSIADRTGAQYSPNTIFLPSGLLPVEVPKDYEPMPEEFSVFVCDARDIQKFRDAAELLFEKSDLALCLSDGGWMSVKDDLENGLKVSLLTTVLYVTGAWIAMVLAVYLYIGKKKKTYAIMRILGASSKLAEKQIVLPFMVLTSIAAPVGGIAGIIYALTNVEATPNGVVGNAVREFIPNRTLPVGAVIMCLVIELAVVLASSFYMLRKMKRKPPLDLLHDSTAKAKKSVSSVPSTIETIQAFTFDISKIAEDTGRVYSEKYSVCRHTMSFIFRHMRRDIGKTALSLILVIVMTAGIGMFVLAMISYSNAFTNVEVRGKAREFSSESIARLSNCAMLEDFYCNGKFTVIVNGKQLYIPLTVTNNIERYLGDKNNVTYAEGYDRSCLDATGQVCLIGQALAEEFGLIAGDEIDIMSDSLYSVLIQKDRSNMIESMSVNYKIIGVVETQDEDIRNGIFTGISCGAQDVYGQPFPMGNCEFRLADNEMLDDVNALLEEEKNNSLKYTSLAYYHIDSDSLKNIRRVCDLMELLFPAAVAAVMLIGLFGSFLIILQSAKEAAFLRILGVSKMRTRCLIALEQTIICLIGIVIATGGIALLGRHLFLESIRTLAICYGLYMMAFICGAVAASVYVTRHGILRLLQGKE